MLLVLLPIPLVAELLEPLLLDPAEEDEDEVAVVGVRGGDASRLDLEDDIEFLLKTERLPILGSEATTAEAATVVTPREERRNQLEK